MAIDPLVNELRQRAEAAERDRDVLVAAMRKAWIQWAGTAEHPESETDDLFRRWKMHNVCGLTRADFDRLILNIAADAKEQK